MNAFEQKAIENQLKTEHPELNCIEIIKPVGRLRTYRAYIEITTKSIHCYTGIEISEDQEEKTEYLSNKIKCTKIAINTIKKGLDNSTIIKENIVWERRNLQMDTGKEKALEMYSRALQKAAGGTYEGFIAFEMLDKKLQYILIDNPHMYDYIEEVLVEIIREELRKINFYKKVRKRTIKTKYKRFLKNLKNVIEFNKGGVNG